MGLEPAAATTKDNYRMSVLPLNGAGDLPPGTVICCKGRLPEKDELLEAKCATQSPALVEIPERIIRASFESTDEKTLAQVQEMTAKLPPTTVIEIADASLLSLLETRIKTKVVVNWWGWKGWIQAIFCWQCTM